MAYTKLIPRHTPGAQVEELMPGDQGKAYRLSIPAGPGGKYRLAQLDDYPQLRRRQFPLRFPPSTSLRTGLSLSLAARTSSASIPGTWGFGLWNDPFGLSLGFGGNPFRLPVLPNAAWFFSASEESYLSFKDTRASSAPGLDTPRQTLRHGYASQRTTRGYSTSSAPRENTGTHLHLRQVQVSQREEAANGFLAQTFRSPTFHPWLVPAGAALPFSRKLTRRLLGKVVGEEGVRLSVDVTQWHRYRLDWREERVAFEVDGVQVLESHVSPHAPLGLVIWIDNQFAAFTPEGKIGFGVLENSEAAWLEIKDIEVTLGASNGRSDQP